MSARTTGRFPAMEYPVDRVEGALNAGVIFICDHASNFVPELLGNLGLGSGELDRHIAYDIGAGDLTRALAKVFSAPAVLSRVSRLVIDANRGIDDPTLVMKLSDGAIIPGNASVDEFEIAQRVAAWWRPYRSCIADALVDMIRVGPVPAVVSIHSFTPVWKGSNRPWDVSVLWDEDPRVAAPLIAALAASGFSVGDNEPYDGALEGDTLYDLATSAGVAHALIEVRQDLLAEVGQIEAMALKIAEALRPVLARQDVHMIRKFGSRARQTRC